MKEAIINRDQESIVNILSSLESNEDWSFVSFIDELLPIMLMEANLKYGSFHTVKMSLFLRKLSTKGHFSKETERKLLSLILNNLVERHWVLLETDTRAYKDDKIFENTVEKMIDELHNSNAHNAYYYSTGLLKNNPEDLCQLLLDLGSIHIPDTLGHSISCFYPVITDILNTKHPANGTALFSLISYLSRFDYKENTLTNKLHNKEIKDYNKLLKLASSGKGIVNLHHMITFYIMTEWEEAPFNKENIVPYHILIEWIGDKNLDKEREKKVDKLTNINKDISNYSQFSELFSPNNLDESIQTLIYLLQTKPEKAIDWVFRVYTDYYTPDWDPHYFTSLYCAIELYRSRNVDKTASKMAIYQAVQYLFKSIS